MKRLLVSLLSLSMITGCSSSKQEEPVIEEKIEEPETKDYLEEKEIKEEPQEVAKEEFEPAQQEEVYPKVISMDQSIYNYVVNGQYRILERGESVFINRWNNRIETNISEGAIPVFYKELTIGSPSIYDFMNMFEIEAGYACVDRETDPYGDGCTDVINETYSSLDFLEKESVLDVLIYFYVENVNGQFLLLPLEDGKEAWNANSDKDILRIKVDFVGECFAQDEGLNSLTPIKIEFTRK